MTAELTEAPRTEETEPAPEPRVAGRRRLPSPGWLALIFTLAVTVVTMRYYGVTDRDLITFAAYSLFCVTLPGTLIWRALQGRAGHLPLDAAFGTAAGFAVELPVYMLARQADQPYAVLAWPILTVVLFTAVPGLRRFWRGNRERMPAGASWSAALGTSFMLWSIALSSFRYNSLTEPYSAVMHVDFPFQFALVGEFKHDVPLRTPWVSGVELVYHWYVYAHGAAASWISGVEPQVLIMRLLPVPMIAAFLLVVIALVHRITGRWWPGNVAILLMLGAAVTVPWGWTHRPMDSIQFIDNLWVSPTQTFAALFCIVAIYVLAGIFQASPGAERRRPLPWVVLTLLIGAMAGAKATFVPMLICGLLLALFFRLIQVKLPGPELPALLISGGWLAFAQLVLYGSGSQGTEVNPLQTVKFAMLGRVVMGTQNGLNDWPTLAALTGISLGACLFGWACMAGLLRRGWRTDPIIHVMLGFAISGLGALYILAHPGMSQTYFGRSATPYLGILTAIGLAALFPAGERLPKRFFPIALLGVAGSVAALLVIRQTAGKDAPPSLLASWTVDQATRPYVVLAEVLAGIVAVLVVIGLVVRLRRPLVLAVAALAVSSVAVTSGVVTNQGMLDALVSGEPQRDVVAPGNYFAMPPGAIDAGRWLRANSHPRDKVATNSHCRAQISPCDSRDFWLAAWSERQVVLEGWSYTEPAFSTGGLWDRTLYRSVFWDPALLERNDQVFYDPTAERVNSFVRDHGVRWLVAVGTTQIPSPDQKGEVWASPELAQFATERYRTGDITVYEVRA
ncbi:hypothetical protein ACTI_08500 [Actinoplanes sp. OR16]|uniref:hypothetical protein n=1 Tax=Actinoplanes sp. OR16 TaxID=946334 RepID=UPI000F6D2D63|nr:hypothetical protein [Actinoplanes sp. OR16]BBH64165.1 hypothetical protein ACTI_08500 [Actinoplanes sp. OR16]